MSLAAAAAPPVPLASFGAVWFCYFAAIGLFNPYAPLWFQELGFSTLAIGTIASLQSWTRVIAPYAWGWLGDHHGRRMRLVRLAALGSMLAAAGLLFARGYGMVAAVTVLLFVANGGVVPLSEAALAHHLATGRGLDAARYGRVRVWGSIGFIIAVTAGGAALQLAGIDWFPVLAVAVFALLWGATLRVPAQHDEAAGSASAPPVLSILRQPLVAWFFASVFFTVLAHVGLYAFFSLYLVSLGYAKSVVGILWAVSVAVEVVFFWFQGRIAARATPLRWLQWAAAGAALRFSLIALFGGQFVVLVLAQLLHMLTFAAHHAACIMLIHRHFPGPLRGRGQALYTMLGYGLSGVIGGVAGGALAASALGFRGVFLAASGSALLGLGCALKAGRAERVSAGAG